MHPHPWFSYLQLSASMALVGTYVALAKPLVVAIPVFALALLRFGMAAVALAPWTAAARDEAPLTVNERWQLFIQSFFGNFLFSICMLSGIALTTAVAAGVILATLPAVVALASWAILRERLSRRTWAAIALAVGGIALLQFAQAPADESQRASLLGNLLLLGAVLCEAIYVIAGKKLAATRAPLRISALINLWGLVLTLPFGLWQLSNFELGTLRLSDWSLLVFYALSASLISVALWLNGLRQVPANQAGVFTVALPIAATVVGVMFLGEPFGGLQAAALVLAASGVCLIALAPRVRR
ncbi:MAG: DMT family transporter [Burkholderiaceae bacterium]